MCFGSELGNYRDMISSVYTLVLALLGDFDFDELRTAHWLLGPALFIVFVFVGVFITFNILIAIISDAYSETEEHLSSDNFTDLGAEMARLVRKSLMQVRESARVYGFICDTYTNQFPVQCSFLYIFSVLFQCPIQFQCVLMVVSGQPKYTVTLKSHDSIPRPAETWHRNTVYTHHYCGHLSPVIRGGTFFFAQIPIFGACFRGFFRLVSPPGHQLSRTKLILRQQQSAARRAAREYVEEKEESGCGRSDEKKV